MKFKNIKKIPPVGVKKNQFPSNSRTIPVSVDMPATFLKIYRLSLKAFVAFIFILAVIVVGLDLQANTQERQTIDLEREKLTKELKYWEDFIAKHQNYRDAYLQASILEYKLGNTSKAKMYVEKGLALDPNSENGRKIEKFLSK